MQVDNFIGRTIEPRPTQRPGQLGVDWYYLKGERPVPKDILSIKQGDMDRQRRVAYTRFGNGCYVSTVFLGLDHAHVGFGSDTGIIVFETMVFGPGMVNLQLPSVGDRPPIDKEVPETQENYSRRYGTMSHARWHHRHIVRKLRKEYGEPTIMQIRQGDLLLVKLTPNEVEQFRRMKATKEESRIGRQGVTKRGNLVIELGETTGHAHRMGSTAVLEEAVALDAAVRQGEEIAVPASVYDAWWEGQTTTLIEVEAPKAYLVHEEHAPVELDEGLWRVQRQREFDPEADNRERLVRD